MKKLLLLLLLTGWIFPVAAQKKLSQVPDGFWVACGDDKVIIIDPEKSSNENVNIVWQWSKAEATALPTIYQRSLQTLDDCKPVDNNRKLLITSSSGATILLDILTRKIDFYTQTPMAHSAALLPGGFIAVANSTHPKGNSIELYHISKPEKVLFKDTLYSGHGVVWHPQKKQLYVLGFDELRSYQLKLTGNKRAKLVKKYTWKLPDEGGHDLSFVNNENLLISSHSGVWNFNTTDNTFTAFTQLSRVKNIKSVNYNSTTGNIVFSKAEVSWWTFNIYSTQPDKVLNIPGIKLYKVRVAQKRED